MTLRGKKVILVYIDRRQEQNQMLKTKPQLRQKAHAQGDVAVYVGYTDTNISSGHFCKDADFVTNSNSEHC